VITVLIADDHAVVREGLSLLLSGAEDVTVAGVAADGEQAVAMVAEHRPDVVLMDLSMPVMDGIEATRLITDELPDTAVVVLTTFSDNRRVMDSLEAGAVGYLMKDSTPADILAGVRAAAQGGSPLDPRVARSIIDARRGAPAGKPSASLTAKQTEVLTLVARGMSNRLIAHTLGISEKTVKAHLTTIYSALGVTDRVQAALWAQRHLEPPAR
jgi:DNA-binding NarL/FixJ family response regulator